MGLKEIMKRLKGTKEVKAERPRRALVSEKDALKRMKGVLQAEGAISCHC